MKRALIQIRNNSDVKAVLDGMGKKFIKTWNSGKAADPVATFTFSSPSQLFSVISPKRWELIEHLQKIGPSSMRGLARSLERDIKRVHDDVTALMEWGIIERTDEGKVCVPYDVIHADFDLRAVA
jgi:predicted transcriptional regulator